VNLTIAQPNHATGRPLCGSTATYTRDQGGQKNRESADSCERMNLDFSPMVFDTWGGLHGSGKDLVQEIFVRCTASTRPYALLPAVGAWR